MRDDVDRTDLRILALLAQNGRMTHAEIARIVGLSSPSVFQRVKRLERLGVIERYSAIVDLAKLGFSLTVLVQVSLSLHREKPIERFRSAVLAIPEVVECHNVSGEFDFLLKVVARGMDDYERLVRERLSTLGGVAKIQSCFVLSTAKSGANLPLEVIAGEGDAT